MLLTAMPSQLQTPGKMGFVQPGFGIRRGPPPEWSARFGSPAYYEGEPNTYTGSLAPFYYDSRRWWNDQTLQIQAPRPCSHAWNDQTLVLQAQRGPDELYGGGGLGAVPADTNEMSTAVKLSIAFGASALLIGGAYLVVKHTIVKQGLM